MIERKYYCDVYIPKCKNCNSEFVGSDTQVRDRDQIIDELIKNGWKRQPNMKWLCPDCQRRKK